MPEENYGLRAQLAQALQHVPRCAGFLVLIKQNAFDEAIASGDEMKRPHELLRSVHDVFKQSLKSWHVALGVSARRVAAIHMPKKILLFAKGKADTSKARNCLNCQKGAACCAMTSSCA